MDGRSEERKRILPNRPSFPKCCHRNYKEFGGADRDRTDDLVIANDALSQLSYGPTEIRP